MVTKSQRPVLTLLLLAAICVQQSLGASSATPSFGISAGTTMVERSPVQASQAFSKQWTISGDVDGQITAIEALALDLPGQVFITYEAAVTSSAKQIGSIKVFGETEMLIEAVSVTTKRAMRGAKLAISSAKSPAMKPAAGNSSTIFETLLTEIVLLRKAALKKVIANGWADVVIADDVLFSKRKEDYTYLSNRALRTTATAADNASSITFTETQHQVMPRGIEPRVVDPTWTILTPTSSDLGNVSLDVQLVGSNVVLLARVDNDFLPEGAIGTVAAGNGKKVAVSSTRSISGHDTLVVNPSGVGAFVRINIAASVKMGSITPRFNGREQGSGILTYNMNETFPDDAVSVFLNGSGNVFVLANNSAVYVQSAMFHVAGSGHMQLEIREMHAATAVTISNEFLGTAMTPRIVTGFVFLDDMVCDWGPLYYSSVVSKEMGDAASAEDKVLRCPVAVVPKKVGGSKPSSISAPSGGSSKGNSSAPSATGAASRSTGVSLYGAALTIAAVIFAALS